MGNTFYFNWEVSLMEFLQAHLGKFGIAFASFCSTLGQEMVMIAVLGFFYWAWDKKCGKHIGLNIVVGGVLFPMIKNIALRRRPYMDHPSIKCLKKVDEGADIMDINSQGYSFPSGHATNSMVAYGSVAQYQKKKPITIIVTIVILLIGISRFCVGVHYPTDVLCGWVLGLLVMAIIPRLSARIKKDWVLFLILLIVGLPGFFYCTSNDFYTSYGMMLGGFSGFLFEEHYVNFEGTRRPLQIVLRVAIGAGLFFALNTALKLPFPTAFLESGTTAALLVRTFRYAVVIFLLIGVYPLSFKLLDKIGEKK